MLSLSQTCPLDRQEAIREAIERTRELICTLVIIITLPFPTSFFFLFADCPSVKTVIPFALCIGFYVQSLSEL